MLDNVCSALRYFAIHPVHPVYFPYALGATLHAARISVAFQANARRNASPLPWGIYIAGYLVMCWGGSFFIQVWLGVPPAILYSIHPYINYLSVHFVLTLLFQLVPSLLNPPLFNSLLFPLDAVLKTNSIALSLAFLWRPSTPSVYSVSLLTHLFVGALASAGGSLSASTLRTWTTEWRLGTPPVLRGDGGVWGALDVWGGALVAAVISTASGNKAFEPVRAALAQIFQLPLVGLQNTRLGSVAVEGVSGKMTVPEASALACVLLAALFGLRVINVHWLPHRIAPVARTSVMRVKEQGGLVSVEPSVRVNGSLEKRGKKRVVKKGQGIHLQSSSL